MGVVPSRHVLAVPWACDWVQGGDIGQRRHPRPGDTGGDWKEGEKGAGKQRAGGGLVGGVVGEAMGGARRWAGPAGR